MAAEVEEAVVVALAVVPEAVPQEAKTAKSLTHRKPATRQRLASSGCALRSSHS